MGIIYCKAHSSSDTVTGMANNTPITYISDDAAYRALGLFYGNQEEAVDNMIALVAHFDGESFRVFEVDNSSFYSGRAFIIVEDGLDPTAERELQEDLAVNSGREVVWNPMFEVVGILTYEASTDHLSTCAKEIPNCPACAEAFQLKENTR